MLLVLVFILIDICYSGCVYCEKIKVTNTERNITGTYTTKRENHTWNPVFFKTGRQQRLRYLNFRNGTCYTRIDKIDSIYPYYTSNECFLCSFKEDFVRQSWTVHLNNTLTVKTPIDIECFRSQNSEDFLFLVTLSLCLVIFVLLVDKILVEFRNRQRQRFSSSRIHHPNSVAASQ